MKAIHDNYVLPRTSQSGLSLIELMIAMLIGIFLLAGVSNSYISSKNSSIKRNQISVLEDNGRFALETISGVLENAGYVPVPGLISKQFITNAADVVNDLSCAGGSVIDSSLLTVTADGASDTLGIIYHGDNDLFTDCGGNQLPVACRLAPPPMVSANPDASKIYNSFSVDNVSKEFNCSGSRTGSITTIANGIENIQFLYGIDNSGDGNIDRYINATAVNAQGMWNNVVSVQVAVLVRSLKPVWAKPVVKQYTLLDVIVNSPSDRFKREVFSRTVRLRNTL